MISTVTIRRIFLMGFTTIGIGAIAYYVLTHYIDEVVRSDSAYRASNWSEILTSQVSDLPQIVNGEIPSDESILFFEQARALGDVWRYRLYNAEGKLILTSNQLGKMNTHKEKLADFHPNAIQSIQFNRIFVATRQGVGVVEPVEVAEVVTPIIFQKKQIGFLELQLDETARVTNIRSVFTKLSLSILSIVLLAFGTPAIAFMRRTQEKEKAEDQLEYLAFHDGLTGLKNRTAISKILESRVAGAESDNEIAVHIIDLDNFKTLNDTMGHDAGDILLRDVAGRLNRICATNCDVARLGGDEFVIVQYGLKKASQAEDLAAQLVDVLRKPSNDIKSTIDTAGSVGTALFPNDGKTPSDLMKSADTALYVAKNAGRACYRMFKPEYDDKLQRRRIVETCLRRALAQNNFVLHFQPIFNLETKTIASVEALLRLNDPEIGSISPVEFIPIAEEAGLIEEIGDWVIAEGCRALAILPKQLRLALNLSAIQFTRGDLVGTVMRSIAEAQIDPRRLELEITESLLLKDSEEIQEKIQRLKAIGCTLALDDFGSGYSSLSYLWRYPFDKIKIDREFISAISNNPDVQGIVEIIIHLAKKLKMVVTAEGVETYDQELALAELDCEQVQGFLYSKPVPMSDLAPFFLRDFLGAKTTPQLSNQNIAKGA